MNVAHELSLFATSTLLFLPYGLERYLETHQLVEDIDNASVHTDPVGYVLPNVRNHQATLAESVAVPFIEVRSPMPGSKY